MIELRGVSLAAGGCLLLENVDAVVARGEFVALLGRNGAGKTTLLRAIAGLHRPRAGTILVDGADAERLSPAARARRVALVTGDETFLESLLVRDVVAVGRFAHGAWWRWQSTAQDRRAIGAALCAVGMEAFASRLFVTLSAGERQRVWIALGLAQATPVLLLDEPTSHLDVAVAHEILRLLRRLCASGTSVLCALHDLNEAMAYADRIALLGEGRLLALTSPAALRDGALLRRAYGVSFAAGSALLPVSDLMS